jgi:methionine synthase I (cobalamin-dependent)
MPDNRFLAALEKRVILGAGAVGTEFLKRGCLSGRPLDELNLTRPHLVLELSQEYVKAGAELIKTNTFLANRFRLKAAGLEKRVRDINIAGAQLARDAARTGFVAGCVGPLSDMGLSDFLVYREQCTALAKGGCDLILFETFTDFADLSLALKAGWSTGLPLVCQVSRLTILPGLARMRELDADIVGVNCIEPGAAATALTKLRERWQFFLSAFPNAGLPGEEMSPRDFAGWIRVLVDSGARLVGGCCGTGPDHIRAAAAALGRGR